MIARKESPESGDVLVEALTTAGKALGLTQADLGAVVGKGRTAISRRDPIEPGGKSGELALLLIRCYRSLFVLVGDDGESMRHWMRTSNRHTGGVPAEQVRSVQGLIRVVEYLDAIRGKT
ncbi:MAG: MbcA/ParS/Xre antitoxin family protein [Gammaproteobacteria bacterium]